MGEEGMKMMLNTVCMYEPPPIFFKLKKQEQELLAIYNSLLMPRYFPFPQPISATIEPLGKAFRNSTMRGHGLCLVLLKCLAIKSYTR